MQAMALNLVERVHLVIAVWAEWIQPVLIIAIRKDAK